MILGILKSAHKEISLNNSVRDNNVTTTSSFEFGSKIASVDLFGEDNKPISLRNGTHINITLDLLPKVHYCTRYSRVAF